MLRFIWVLMSCLALAQSPVFEVAAIKSNKGTGERGREKVDAVPGSLTMRNVSLRSAIKWAYDVRGFQITGPNVLDAERFDITAKASDAVPVEQMRPMLQALLADRFKMALHRESKQMTVYSLVVAKGGPKCKPSQSEGESVLTPPKQFGSVCTAVRMPVSWLLDPLSDLLRTVVLDETGLKGLYGG